MQINIIRFFLTAIALLVLSNVALANASQTQQPPRIATTIKPLHSIIANITDNVSHPYLIIEGNYSPHYYSLKPSNIKNIYDSDIIIAIDKDFEIFLNKTIKNFSDNQQLIYFTDINNITKYPLNDEHKNESFFKKLFNSNDEIEYDKHVWLSPDNTLILADYVKSILVDKDPLNSSQYEKNFDSFKAKIENHIERAKSTLNGLQGKKYLVHHDAFTYFEKFYGFEHEYALASHDGNAIGVKRIREINDFISENNNICLFIEPKFSEKLALSFDRNKINVTYIDHLGVQYNKGKDNYFLMLEDMVEKFSTCLGDKDE